MNDCRSADDQENAGGFYRLLSIIPDRRIERLAEPNDTGTRDRAARETQAYGRLAAHRASFLPNAAMQPENVPATGTLVKPIDILRHESEVRSPLFKLDKRAMSGIWLSFRDYLAPPPVPLPNQLRIPLERHWCCKIFGLMVPPQSAGSAERWNAAFRGDAGAGEGCNTPCRAEQPAYVVHPYSLTARGEIAVPLLQSTLLRPLPWLYGVDEPEYRLLDRLRGDVLRRRAVGIAPRSS
jgi:hypothetical protein